MKKRLLTFLFAIVVAQVWAEENQDSEQSAPKSAIELQRSNAKAMSLPHYGSLLIDWGFPMLRNCPQEMNSASLGARFLDVYFYYNIPLGRSHCYISLGTGWGADEYRFTKRDDNRYTLVRVEEGKRTEFEDFSTVVPRSDQKSRRAKLNLSYWDFLLEIRFSADCEYPKEGFFVAVGGKLGALLNSSTTLWYKEDNENKCCTFYDSFNLNQIRYGAQARLGYSRLSLLYTYIFSTLFAKDQGPHNSATKPHNIGLSIDIF